MGLYPKTGNLNLNPMSLFAPRVTTQGLKVNLFNPTLRWEKIGSASVVEKHRLPYLLLESNNRSYWFPLYLGDFNLFRGEILDQTDKEGQVYTAIAAFNGPTDRQTFVGRAIAALSWSFVIFLLGGTLYQSFFI